MNNFKELSTSEYLEISGGSPDLDSGWAYDVGYAVGTGIAYVEDAYDEVASWF
jgi:hypothetical protein